MIDRHLVQARLDQANYKIGDRIGNDVVNRSLIIGNGFNDTPWLSIIGVDRYGRVWKQDNDGLEFVGYLSSERPPEAA